MLWYPLYPRAAAQGAAVRTVVWPILMVVFVARIITTTAQRAAVDLNGWHHAIHQITGDIALRFNGATAADLEHWAKLLREVAEEMEAVAKV